MLHECMKLIKLLKFWWQNIRNDNNQVENVTHKIQDIFTVFEAITRSTAVYRKVSKPTTQMSLWQELKNQRTCLSMHLVQWNCASWFNQKRTFSVEPFKLPLYFFPKWPLLFPGATLSSLIIRLSRTHRQTCPLTSTIKVPDNHKHAPWINTRLSSI